MTMREARTLFENLKLPYFRLDERGVLVEASASLCAALGYECEEVVGRPLSDFGDPVQVSEMMARVTSDKYAEKDLGMRCNRQGILYARAAVAQLENEHDEVSGYYGVLQRLTSERADFGRFRHITDREKAIARNIQESFLPRELPALPGWELVTYFKAAQVVAGDFYDAFPLAGGRRVGVVIADVCDKGVGAALFMALIRSLLRAFADQHYALGWMDVLDDFGERTVQPAPLENRRELLSAGATSLKKAVDLTHKYVLKNHEHTNMFATLFFAVIDPETGAVSYINAGHEAPVVLSEGRIKCRLEPTGIAIGLPIEFSFHIKRILLEPGEMLFAYTDGVTDAQDPEKNFFTQERLLGLLEERTDSAAALLEIITQELRDHVAVKEQYDDITMLAVRRRPAE
jgi:sigma-B regulation protein RsbU (phosphoserine phosphatase)